MVPSNVELPLSEENCEVDGLTLLVEDKEIEGLTEKREPVLLRDAEGVTEKREAVPLRVAPSGLAEA